MLGKGSIKNGRKGAHGRKKKKRREKEKEKRAQ